LKKPNNFLQDFIKKELYLQNPPLETDKFIKFCEKRGIQTSKKELEFFEKEELLFPIVRIERPIEEEEKIKVRKEDGKEYCKPAKDGLNAGETGIERYKVKFYSSYGFSEYDKDLLLNWLQEGNLFDPTTKEFQSWDTFLGEELEYEKQKIVSFYSSFQIYWLEILKNSFSITIDLAGEEIRVNSSLVLLNNRPMQGSFTLSKIDDFMVKLKEIIKKKPFEEYFSLENKKEKLKENYKKFNKLLKFLLSVQSIYYPYVKSGGRTIHIAIDEKKWYEAKLNFKLETILNKINLQIEDVAKWYKIFSDRAQDHLGGKGVDWIQLIKNVAWHMKDKLEGGVRLGVEYLQWAVMLKRIIEDYKGKIWDVDEMSNISPDKILKFDIREMNQYSIRPLRLSREKRYSGGDKSYYHDIYKRLFYLANNYELDYQPRLTVFVEGSTEEIIFPEIFDKYVGNKPENLGVEFINIQGISQFFGQTISITNKNNRYQKAFINNFNNLISYNLNKWQIVPFFIADDENNITSLLKKGISISFNQEQYTFPEDWQYIWGITNNNNPFIGKDFEMTNFGDDEIAIVLSEELQKKITNEQVKKIRETGGGIKQIDKDVEKNKIEITKRLYQNLFDKYDKEKNESIFERPVFKVMKKITRLAVLNHPPVDTNVEMINREYFEKKLKNNPSPKTEKEF